jgi:hypothetical protein
MWLCELQTLQASQPHHYCELQTLQASQPHNYFLITLSPLRLCELQTLQASQPHHYFLISFLVWAVSAANFAGFTGT